MCDFFISGEKPAGINIIFVVHIFIDFDHVTSGSAVGEAMEL